MLPTTALGDWYANVFNVGRLRLVHLVSDRSLLSVIVPAKKIHELAIRHRHALAQVLTALGIEEALLEAELVEMTESTIGRTRSRSVLASMRDLALNARYRLWTHPYLSTMDVAIELAEVPCGPLGMRHPGEVAASLLRNRYGQPAATLGAA